ncbi:MAG: DNA internalization-related competence protein ComEC/Rec2 [Bacteroidetes bacterium]|nr:DNA internalization-related competence protein ComEC/Rec2 [Bacteroidota bacterium]
MSRLIFLISHNLLLTATLAYLIGIVLSIYIAWLFSSYFYLLPPFMFFLYSRFYYKNVTGQLFCLVVIFVFTGGLVGKNIDTPPQSPQHIYNKIKEKEEIVVFGTLTTIEGFNGEITKVKIAVKGIQRKTTDALSKTSGTILLSYKQKWPDNILPGDSIAIRCYLTRPNRYKTPGSFDYPTYLKRKNIWITGYITSSLFIQKIQTENKLIDKVRYFPERMRQDIRKKIEMSVAQPESDVFKALLIADKSGLDHDLLEGFKGSGCMHILTISGLHLSLLGSFLFFLFFWLLRRSEWLILHVNVKKCAALLCIPPLLTYTLIAGANPPVLRSLVMALIVITALLSNRIKSIHTIISCAALLILAFNPSSLLSASFQLTFAAVISITTILPHLKHKINSHTGDKTTVKSLSQNIILWIYMAFAVSIAATVGTAPLLLYYYNRISLIGPFANLIVEPFLCLWGLPFGLAGSALLPISSFISTVLFKIGSIGLSFGIEVVTFFNSLHFSSLWLPTPSLPLIFIFYFSILLFITFRASSRVGCTLSSLCIFFACLILFIFPPQEIFKKRRKNITLTFLDVGHGSACLLEMPGGKRILFDGGGITAWNFDIGEQVIAPFLWQKGITQIDDVIISHPDRDHISGLPFIIRKFRPQTIWTNTLSEKDRFSKDFLQLIRDLDIDVKKPSANLPIFNRNGSKIIVLPNPYTVNDGIGKARYKDRSRHGSDNDNGLIVKFIHNNFSVLFPGDISGALESQLIQDEIPLQSSILLSPHHGSHLSNTSAFLDAVHPRAMIVSSGQSKNEKRSIVKLKEKCLKNNISFLSTSEQGSIEITHPAKRGRGRGLENFRFRQLITE